MLGRAGAAKARAAARRNGPAQHAAAAAPARRDRRLNGHVKASAGIKARELGADGKARVGNRPQPAPCGIARLKYLLDQLARYGIAVGIDATAVNVIGAGQDGPADHLVNDTADRVDAYAATKGRVESMMSLVSTCIDEKKNISFIVAMQNAAVVIGFVLVAFLTFVAGVEQISAFALVIYELFWVLATVLVPKFRNKVK